MSRTHFIAVLIGAITIALVVWYFTSAERKIRRMEKLGAEIDVVAPGMIEVRVCRDIPRSRLGEIARIATRIPVKTLEVSSESINDEDFEEFLTLHDLRRLYVSRSALTEVSLSRLNVFTKLESLQLQGVKLSSAVVTAISSMPQLRVMLVWECDLTGVSFAPLEANKALVSADFCGSRFGSPLTDGMRFPSSLTTLFLASTDISDEHLRGIVRHRSLREVKLSNTRITAPSIDRLAQMRELHALWLDDCLCVHDSEMEQLSTLSKLRLLSLNGADITDKGIAAMSGASQLRELHIARTNITDAAIDMLEQMPSLKFVDVSGTLTTVRARERLSDGGRVVVRHSN